MTISHPSTIYPPPIHHISATHLPHICHPSTAYPAPICHPSAAHLPPIHCPSNFAHPSPIHHPSATHPQYSQCKSRQICSRVRGILHNTLKVERGAHTYAELLDLCDMQHARRILEKRFPILTIAENQWAANSYMQETVRNDRPRNSGQGESPPSAENGPSHQSATLPEGNDVVYNCSAEPEPALATSTPARRRPPMAAAPPKRKRIRSRKQEHRIEGSEN